MPYTATAMVCELCITVASTLTRLPAPGLWWIGAVSARTTTKPQSCGGGPCGSRPYREGGPVGGMQRGAMQGVLSTAPYRRRNHRNRHRTVQPHATTAPPLQPRSTCSTVSRRRDPRSPRLASSSPLASESAGAGVHMSPLPPCGVRNTDRDAAYAMWFMITRSPTPVTLAAADTPRREVSPVPAHRGEVDPSSLDSARLSTRLSDRLSAQHPAPGSAASPTRPGIFSAMPPLLTAAAARPWPSTTTAPTVSATRSSTSAASLRPRGTAARSEGGGSTLGAAPHVAVRSAHARMSWYRAHCFRARTVSSGCSVDTTRAHGRDMTRRGRQFCCERENPVSRSGTGGRHAPEHRRRPPPLQECLAPAPMSAHEAQPECCRCVQGKQRSVGRGWCGNDANTAQHASSYTRAGSHLPMPTPVQHMHSQVHGPRRGAPAQASAVPAITTLPSLNCTHGSNSACSHRLMRLLCQVRRDQNGIGNAYQSSGCRTA